MSSVVLNMDFTKIDEENFSIKETREVTTEINIKDLIRKLENFKKDVTNKIVARKQELQTLENAIKTYNEAVDQAQKAKDDFGYDVEVPEHTSIEQIQASLETKDAE